jgi:hypothetical protein
MGVLGARTARQTRSRASPQTPSAVQPMSATSLVWPAHSARRPRRAVCRCARAARPTSHRALVSPTSLAAHLIRGRQIRPILTRLGVPCAVILARRDTEDTGQVLSLGFEPARICRPPVRGHRQTIRGEQCAREAGVRVRVPTRHEHLREEGLERPTAHPFPEGEWSGLERRVRGTSVSVGVRRHAHRSPQLVTVEARLAGGKDLAHAHGWPHDVRVEALGAAHHRIHVMSSGSRTSPLARTRMRAATIMHDTTQRGSTWVTQLMRPTVSMAPTSSSNSVSRPSTLSLLASEQSDARHTAAALEGVCRLSGDVASRIGDVYDGGAAGAEGMGR